MPPDPLPTFEVPAVDEMPQTASRCFDVAAFTDFLLTQLFRSGSSLLHSDLRADEGRWRILTWSAESYGSDEVVAVTPEKAHFRAVLAHLGTRFLNGQVYGGFAEGIFDQRDASRYFAMYVANDQLRGYWLRLYVMAT